MTRRAFLTRQRDTRRRRDVQAAGASVAALVRQKRESLSAGVAAAPVTPSTAGDGPHDVAGSPPDRAAVHPPLLPLGFHRMSLTQLRQLCCDRFPTSSTRPRIATGLGTFVGALYALGFEGTLWIGGSFVTQKIDPADVDVVFHVQGEQYAPLVDLVLHIERGSPQTLREAWSVERQTLHEWAFCDRTRPSRDALGVDPYVLREWPKGHPRHAQWQEGVRYWLRRFVYVDGRQRRGLATLRIPHDVTHVPAVVAILEARR